MILRINTQIEAGGFNPLTGYIIIVHGDCVFVEVESIKQGNFCAENMQHRINKSKAFEKRFKRLKNMCKLQVFTIKLIYIESKH